MINNNIEDIQLEEQVESKEQYFEKQLLNKDVVISSISASSNIIWNISSAYSSKQAAICLQLS